MKNEQALFQVSTAAKRQNGNAANPDASNKMSAAPLTVELVAGILAGRGLRGWLRALRVAKVLGLFALYLFLDTYDIRADFNRRMEARKRDVISLQGWLAGLRAWTRVFALASLDKTIRLLRLIMFRGRD